MNRNKGKQNGGYMAAKRILTSRATENMVVADDVYTSDDKLVIPEGTVLTEDIIKSLKDYGIFAIRIKTDDKEDDTSAEENTDETVDEQEHRNYLRQIKESKEFEEFHGAFIESVDELKNIFNKVVMHNEEIDSESILQDVENVVSKGRNSLHILDMLQLHHQYL